MTLIRCCLIALCIMFAAGSYAQERATPPPDGPQPSSDKRKARLALLSQISSKSPSGSSFMAKLEDPVEVEGQPVLPKGTLVEGHLETIPARRMMRRGALCNPPDSSSPQPRAITLRQTARVPSIPP